MLLNGSDRVPQNRVLLHVSNFDGRCVYSGTPFGISVVLGLHWVPIAIAIRSWQSVDPLFPRSQSICVFLFPSGMVVNDGF